MGITLWSIFFNTLSIAQSVLWIILLAVSIKMVLLAIKAIKLYILKNDENKSKDEKVGEE
ncbi:MAG: hypothetical protein RRZ73_06620 [Oscillospiraceae bacterium]